MSTTALDKKIASYLGQLNVSQKKAVLTVVKTFVHEQAVDSWKDEDSFVKEMDKRYTELKTGKVKRLTLEEMESRARFSIKARK